MWLSQHNFPGDHGLTEGLIVLDEEDRPLGLQKSSTATCSRD